MLRGLSSFHELWAYFTMIVDRGAEVFKIFCLCDAFALDCDRLRDLCGSRGCSRGRAVVL